MAGLQRTSALLVALCLNESESSLCHASGNSFDFLLNRKPVDVQMKALAGLDRKQAEEEMTSALEEWALERVQSDTRECS